MSNNIDFRHLVVLLLPSFLRGRNIVSLMRALVAPLVSLNYRRQQAEQDTIFRIRHTGQVCYLRDALNRYFNLTLEDGFEIDDVRAEGDFLIAYNETEWLADRQLIIPDPPDTVIAYDEDTIFSTKDFIVLCPNDIYSDTKDKMPVVRQIVEQYRLCSRQPEYKLKK